MEPKNDQSVETTQISSFNQLKKVTPISKYLALGLFIVLPFIGGLVGYTYAPEKVVEVHIPNRIEKKSEVQVKPELTPISNTAMTEGLSIQNEYTENSIPRASIFYSESGKSQYLGQSVGCNVIENESFDIADIKEQTLKAYVNRAEGINYVKNWSVQNVIQCYYAGGGHRFVLINQGDPAKTEKIVYVSTMDEIVGSGSWAVVLSTQNGANKYVSVPLRLLQDFTEAAIDTALLDSYMKLMIELY